MFHARKTINQRCGTNQHLLRTTSNCKLLFLRRPMFFESPQFITNSFVRQRNKLTKTNHRDKRTVFPIRSKNKSCYGNFTGSRAKNRWPSEIIHKRWSAITSKQEGFSCIVNSCFLRFKRNIMKVKFSINLFCFFFGLQIYTETFLNQKIDM